MSSKMPTGSTKDEPKWLVPLSYVAALSLFTALVFFRNDPWTRGSVAALIVASAMSVGVFRVMGKIALGVPVAPLLYRPPIGEPTNAGWFDRPFGVLLQYTIVTCAAAALALGW